MDNVTLLFYMNENNQPISVEGDLVWIKPFTVHELALARDRCLSLQILTEERYRTSSPIKNVNGPL